MAYAFVAATAPAGDSNVITIPSTTAGNMLVLLSRTSAGGGAPDITGVVDNASSAGWAVAQARYVANSAHNAVWYCKNVNSGATSVTVTYSGGTPGTCKLAVLEYSGLDTTAPFIAVIHAEQTDPGTGTDAVSSGNYNLTTVPALVMGYSVLLDNSSITSTAGTGFTERVGTNEFWMVEDKRNTSTGNTAATATTATSTFDFTTMLLAFAEPGVPALSSPTPSGTLGTATTATIGCTTDTASGTLYRVVSLTNNVSGATAAQIAAGNHSGGSAADFSGNSAISTTTPSASQTGLAAGTLYYYALCQNGTSNVVSGSFTTDSPTLSSATPSGAIGTSTTATVGATSDLASGTLYWVVGPDGAVGTPTGSEIEAGQYSGGGAAAFSGSEAVVDTSPDDGVTGLTAATVYDFALVQKVGSVYSNILTGTFTTASAAATKLTITGQPANTVVGATMAGVIVEAQSAGNVTDTAYTSNIVIALQTGSGTLAGTLTKAAVAGVANFNDLSINTLNTGAVLRATSSGLTLADSSTFNITAGGGSSTGIPSTSILGGVLR